MKHQKILNSLHETSDSRIVTREWDIVNDLSNSNYDVGNEIIYNTEVLKSNLYDCNDAYILVRADITIAGDNGTQVAFKNCAPFIKYITKINGTTIYDAGELDLAMPICNLLQYSSHYSDATDSLSFYSKGKANNFNGDIANTNAFKSFDYKASLMVIIRLLYSCSTRAK